MGRPTGIKYRTSTPYCDTFYTLTCTKGKVVLARRMRADTTVRAPDLRQRAPSLLFPWRSFDYAGELDKSNTDRGLQVGNNKTIIM